MMEKIWAPWRVKYVTEIIGKDKGCVFCRMIRQDCDARNLIFVRRETCFAVLNLYPYNNGHVLVMPKRHVNDIDKLRLSESQELFDLLCYVKNLLQKSLKPNGFNIGMNLGRAGGAGFPGHVHMHIVPRWNGDVNFMPVTGNTKVISQSLASLHARLAEEHQRFDQKPRRRKSGG